MIFLNPEIKANKDLPNMALAYAATILEAKVIDLNTKPQPQKRFLGYKTDTLGISIQARAFSEAQKIKKEYKEKYPGARVKSVQTPIDVQCCYPFVNFDDLTDSEPIIIEDNFSDDLPFPNYELFDSFAVFKSNWKAGKWAFPIMTSLGCPFQCVYCAARNRAWRARSCQNCFEELKQAKARWGIKSFQVIDDCFSLDKKRVLEFCRLIRPLKLNWFCTNGLRVDLFDEEIADAMSRSGCRQMSFGVETIDPKLLERIKKGVTVEKIELAVEIAEKYFKTLNLYFIIGLPESSYQKDLKSFHWALKNRVKAHFSYFVPSETKSPFYGKGAKPVSRAYDKRLQKRIYAMAGYMRGDVNNVEIFKNVLRSFTFILVFDTKNTLSHFSNFLSIAYNKVLNSRF